MVFSRHQITWFDTILLCDDQFTSHEMLQFGARQRKNISVEDQRRDIQLNDDLKIISWLKDLEE